MFWLTTSIAPMPTVSGSWRRQTDVSTGHWHTTKSICFSNVVNLPRPLHEGHRRATFDTPVRYLSSVKTRSVEPFPASTAAAHRRGNLSGASDSAASFFFIASDNCPLPCCARRERDPCRRRTSERMLAGFGSTDGRSDGEKASHVHAKATNSKQDLTARVSMLNFRG